jgi:creatinine amidohydrolase
MKYIFFLLFVLASGAALSQQRNKNNKAIFLEDISWTEAQKVLTRDAVIVIPLGAAAKEHGPHLPLSTDLIQAEGLRDIIALERKVIIAPAINYGYYPAFVKYPGSTTTYWNTSRDMVLQVIRTLAGFGPRRFYIINIGVSTTPTLKATASILKEEGIVLYYSDYSRPDFDNADKGIRTEGVYSGHADEMESSHVLYYRADLVDLTKAANDSSVKDKRGPMTPVPLEGGTYNPTGINGYAALATKQKGALYARVFANELLKDIDSVTSCALPVVKDRREQYKLYEGVYEDAAGKKLVIGQEDNHLYYIWNGIDQRKFYPLYYESEDKFSSVPLEVLFIRNEKNEIIKAWCSFRGEVFWATRK